MHRHTRDVDIIEEFFGIYSVVGVATLIKSAINTEIGFGVTHQLLNTCVIDIVDINIERCKYGMLTEVCLTFVFRQCMDSGNVGIDTIDKIVDGGIR